MDGVNGEEQARRSGCQQDAAVRKEDRKRFSRGLPAGQHKQFHHEQHHQERVGGMEQAVGEMVPRGFRPQTATLRP